MFVFLLIWFALGIITLLLDEYISRGVGLESLKNANKIFCIIFAPFAFCILMYCIISVYVKRK